MLNSITPVPCQSFLVKYQNNTFPLHLDSGATVSFIKLQLAQSLNVTIYPNGQLAQLADEQTRMQSLGEINILITTNNKILLRLRALVVKQLQVGCYGGTTFHVDNGIEANISSGKISLHNGNFEIMQYNKFATGGPPAQPPPAQTIGCIEQTGVISDEPVKISSSVTKEELDNQLQQMRTEIRGIRNEISPLDNLNKTKLAGSAKEATVHVKEKKNLFPGGTYEIKLNAAQIHEEYITVIPQFHKPDHHGPEWRPQVCQVKAGNALYENNSGQVLEHPGGVHFHTIATTTILTKDLTDTIIARSPGPKLSSSCDVSTRFSEMKINYKVMTDAQCAKLDEIHKRNYRVFDDDLSEGYADYAAKINFKKESQAPPYKLWAPQFNKKCQELLQSKCDELEHQGVLADPIDHGINVRNVSPCFIQQKARAKHKKLEDCALEEIRFISCFNVLNDSIRAIPSISSTYENVVKFLARHKYFIFADLLNSYFQIRIDGQDWKHLGIMTPHRGLKVLTRLGQGLLNSDVVLDQVLGKVLGDETSGGICLAARDDLFVGGDSIDETIANWDKILTKLERANLKVTARKVRVFLEDTEVFGHRITNGEVSPSDHTVTSLGDIKMDEIKTNKQLNSWRGLYKTLIQHLPDLASMMAPFDKVTANKPVSGLVDWTVEGRVAAFNRAKLQLKRINKLYLPRPEEKLILMPDTACEDNCTGWVLYTQRDGKNLPAQFCSAKLAPYMANWFPCEKEGVGAVLAIDQCRHWINESHHITTVLADNQPVVDAAKMMKLGRHSKSPRLQSLLSSVNRSNVQFMHSSAKAGEHVVPDRLSRLKRTCGAKDCQTERFLDDIPANIQCMSTLIPNLTLEDLIFGNMEPASLGASSSELSEILCKGRGAIPLGSRAAWLEIQRSNIECRKYLDQVKYGQLPGKKDSSKANLNKMRKNCIVEKGLIVCKSFDNILMRERSRVFVPGEFLKSILTVIHVRLDHISTFQLENVFNRYFFGILTNGTCKEVTEECSLCVSLQKYPKELDQFNPKLEPEHPGSHMNADVMQRAGQKILINTDLFSGYTTACFLESETKEEMIRGLLLLTTPMRHSPEIMVRVDTAPALKALLKSGSRDLSENGLKLVAGEDMNKNSNCSVDKKMQELQVEIKKLCPTETKISLSTLSRAVTNLNERIRNQGLTSSQVQFSRDTVSGENLNLDDRTLLKDKLEKRKVNNVQSAKSKTPKGKEQTKPNLNPGDIAYVKSQGSKHQSREPFLVTAADGDKVKMQKILHSHYTSNRGPALSSEVKTVHSRFLFKQKSSTIRSSSPLLSENVKEEDRYIIPQRRSTRKTTSTWVPNQSAECTTDDDDSEHHDGDNEENEVTDGSEETIDTHSDVTNENSRDRDNARDDAFDDMSDNSPGRIDPGMDPSQDDDQQNEVIQGDDVDTDEHIDGAVGGDDILYFEDGQDLFAPERLCQHRVPRRHDHVAFFHRDLNRWRQVHLTSNALKGYRCYYNCVYDDGEEDGVELSPDLRWTFIDESSCADCANPPQHVAIAQLDGLHIPGSLTPTPDTTPEKEDGPREPIRFGLDDYLDSSNEESPVPILDKSFTGSPEWDSYGTHLERPLLFDQPPRRITNLDRPVDMSLVLPLTSTPIPHSRPRVSGQRKLLPLEVKDRADDAGNRTDEDDDQHPPKFLSKLNPFRKKKGR